MSTIGLARNAHIHGTTVSTIELRGTNVQAVPHYLLNEPAVTHARRLIDAQSVHVRERLGESSAHTKDEDILRNAPVGCVRPLAPGTTDRGGDGREQGRYAFVYGDLRRVHRIGTDRLPVPGGRVAPQGDRARGARAPAASRQRPRLTPRRSPHAGGSLQRRLTRSGHRRLRVRRLYSPRDTDQQHGDRHEHHCTKDDHRGRPDFPGMTNREPIACNLFVAAADACIRGPAALSTTCPWRSRRTRSARSAR